MAVDVSFDAELWRWEANSAWHFVTLPTDVADAIEDEAPERRGFGSVRVEVTIGPMTWSTSVFPDKKRASFVLPVKAQVRRANGVAAGEEVRVHLRTL